MNFEESLVGKQQVENRENLYGRVESKVQSILELRRLVDESGDLGVEELSLGLEGKLQEIKGNIDPEKIAKYELLLEKKRRLEEVYAKEREISGKSFSLADSMEDDDLDFEYAEDGKGSGELEILEAESYDLIAEIRELEEDDDVAFILKLESFKDSMKEKREESLKLKNRLETDQAFLSEFILGGYVPEDDVEIQYPGFCVNIILSPKDYRNVRGGNSVGVHFAGSVINLIMDSPEKAVTIRHEENHNLAESFVPDIVYINSFIRQLNEKAERIERLIELDAHLFIIDKDKMMLQDAIVGYYEHNYSEIVADMDRLPTGDMGTFLVNYAKTEDKLRAFAASIKNEDLRNEVDQKISEMEKKFIKYFFDLSNVFYFANKIGKAEEAKALVILFGNGDGIRKIERHLRSYDSGYDDSTLLRRFTGEIDYLKVLKRGKSPEEEMLDMIYGVTDKSSGASSEFGIELSDLKSFKRIRDIVISGDINEETKKAIESRMVKMTTEDFFESKNYNFFENRIDFYMEIVGCFEEICKSCGLSDEIVGIFKYGLFSNYIKHVFSQGEFSELEENYVDGFGGFFDGVTMKGIIGDELSSKHDDYYTEKGEIRSSKMQVFLDKVGIGSGVDDVE